MVVKDRNPKPLINRRTGVKDRDILSRLLTYLKYSVALPSHSTRIPGRCRLDPSGLCVRGIKDQGERNLNLFYLRLLGVKKQVPLTPDLSGPVFLLPSC